MQDKLLVTILTEVTLGFFDFVKSEFEIATEFPAYDKINEYPVESFDNKATTGDFPEDRNTYVLTSPETEKYWFFAVYSEGTGFSKFAMSRELYKNYSILMAN